MTKGTDKTIEIGIYSIDGAKNYRDIQKDDDIFTAGHNAEVHYIAAVQHLKEAVAVVSKTIKIDAATTREFRELVARDYAGTGEAHLRVNFEKTHYQGSRSGHLKPDDLMGVDVTQSNVDLFLNSIDDAANAVTKLASKFQVGTPVSEEEVISGIQKAIKNRLAAGK